VVPNGRDPSGGISIRDCVNHSGSFQRQSSSASSLTAGAAGFLNLSQIGGDVSIGNAIRGDWRRCCESDVPNKKPRGETGLQGTKRD
jgi:hypothetical protein